MRLEVRNLIKTYTIKNQDPVKALDDVSLLFPETGLVFILGKSGSGKSTLLNVMGGLDSLDSGEIIINDRSSKSFSGSEMDSYRNTYLGFIFQEYNILNDFNIHDNVALAIELQNRKADEATINAILEEVDLKGFGKRKPSEMSGGQKQRVAIARALVKDPKIIFADEPTGALDSNTGKAVFETLRKLSKTRLVVCVSHDRDFAEHFGDRVIEMKDGKVISDISKRNVEPEGASTGISLIGDNVIRFSKGRELTAADLPIINAALKKSEGESFLSIDKHVNETIRESARIAQDGSREEFFDTKAEDVKAGTGKFKAIKSRFPMKDAFRMGAKSMGVKPVRLTFTILLSFTAFALFGLTATMARVNAVDVEANTLADAGVKLIDVRRSGDYYGNGFNDATVEKMAKEFGTKVHPYVDLSLNTNHYYTKSGMTYINNPYYLSHINKGLVLDDGVKSMLGYEIIGKEPKAEDEIAVTDWYALAFRDLGWTDNKGTYHEPNTFQTEDLIGMKLGNYKVTGIVNTHIEDKLSEYSSLKGVANFDNWSIETKVRNITSSAKAGFAFLSKEGLKNYIAKNSNGSIFSTDYVSGGMNSRRVNFASENFAEDVIYFDENKTSLDEDEVLITEGALSNFMYNNNLPRIGNDPIDVTGVPHIEGGNVVTTAITINEVNLKYAIGDVAMRKLAGDKYTTFPYDYPQKFIEASANDSFNLSFDEGTSTLYQYNGETNAYDIEFKPFEAMTKSQVFGYLYNILNHEVDSNYYDFGTGQPRRNTSESVLLGLPYYSDYATYHQNAKTFLVSEYSSKGYGLSLYAWASSKAYEDANSEYITVAKAREWWQQTILIDDSYARDYLAYQRSMNPDYQISTMSDYDYVNAFTGFIESCKGKTNGFTGEYGYAPLPEEEPYYEAYLAIFNAKRAEAATYVKGAEPISFYIHDMKAAEESEDSTIKVVGIALVNGDNYRFNEAYIASNATIAKYVGSNKLDQGAYTGLLVETSNPSTIKRLVQYCDKEQRRYFDNGYSGTYWNIEEPNYSTVASVMNTIEIMMKVFLYVGLFFLAFSMLLFYTFISASISNKRREIGILRAVGARGSDVFKVFYSESFIIALINFVLASIGTIAISLVLNYNFSNEIGFPITLLKPGVIELSFVLAATLVASFISALLPVLRIAHQKPIDAIRGK